ncbi:ABC transporter ATP-binding protein [Clostridium formicaceticum]|uniref:Macrolide ABC transporter ATP-binding protein n=1 Tax=Clostridium formicaceticum TaxID=1497 RepID=A0AAC9RLS1_9CLOT|nr:ABC transporter ATP-binding protein [Clostridium formicaceticum]AOY77139.1 macrolide ABC transporter ATP-binding protein [Clostridium formicaceticum]ARE87655.1 Macrolide export ATP-binding/permease protein MacB [Clostridium formicaceticum]
MKQKLIDMKDIVKFYKMGKNKLTVLNQVSLEVEEGEFVAVLGPSGSGKSTLMNIIGCIDIASSGEFTLAGENIMKKSEDELAHVRNKVVGFIFQRFNLLPKYTAIHNVAFPLFLRGLNKKDAYREASELLKKVGLGDRVNHKPMELSGGQQQRVSIARALVGKPKILLADEPTGALDSKSGGEIMELFLELNKDGNTIVLITHDLEIAKKAHRIIHVKDGKIHNFL